MNINDSGIYNVYIDFTKMHVNKFPNIVFNEKDTNTSKIRIYILSNGELIDLTNIQVDIKIMNSQFRTSVDKITKVNSSEGYIDYEFKESNLIAGVGLFQLKLFEDSKVKITPKIRYKVIKSI